MADRRRTSRGHERLDEVIKANPNLNGNYVFAPLPQIYPDKPFAPLRAFSSVVNGKSADHQRQVAYDVIRYMEPQQKSG
jgi:hypothetical protein